jgi:heme-degrading monooxygenase HmoA
MIARVWSARLEDANLEPYRKHFTELVLPKLRKVEGYVSASLFRRESNGTAEILVTTFWRSYEAIDAFAGPDREHAVVAQGATHLFSDYDDRVKHYETVLSDRHSWSASFR